METKTNEVEYNKINVLYQKSYDEISNNIVGMLKNIYKNLSDLEILIINKISYNEAILLENKIDKILNGSQKNLRNFSVNVFYSCNKITIRKSDGSEFDIFSSYTNFSIIFLRYYETDFIISKIIQGDNAYPAIVEKSFFKNLAKY